MTEARFVYRKNMRGGLDYRIEYGPPNFGLTKAERDRRGVIRLTHRASTLTLDQLVFLFEHGALQNCALYRLRDLPGLKPQDPRAFAKYRERVTTWEKPAYADPPVDRLAERRRLIKTAQDRRDAVRSIGKALRSLGYFPKTTAQRHRRA